MTRVRTTTESASEFLNKTAADAKRSKDLKRELGKDTPYKKENIHHVTDMLSSLYQGSSALMSASKSLTDISAHEISPDGKLGGNGYVMQIKQIREDIATAMNLVANLTDTLADELTNPKWDLTEDQVEDFKSKAKSGEKTTSADAIPASESTDEVPSTDEMDKIIEGFGDNAPVSTDGMEPAADDTAQVSAEPEAPAAEPAQEIEPAAPEAPAATAIPETAPVPVPYKKLASYLGNPELDTVAKSMRAPILFNLLDGHPAGRH